MSRRRLTRDLIVTTAVELLDEVGLDGFNVRALADQLGVRQGALYRHVASKDELLALVTDALLAAADEPFPPTDDGWQSAVRALALRQRALLRAHPAMVSLLANGYGGGARWLAMLEAQLAMLRRAGFTPSDALSVCSAVNDLVTGSAEFSRHYEPAVWTRLAGLPTGDFPSIVEVARVLRRGGDERVFSTGLDALVAGFETVRQRTVDAAARAQP